ncbi:MAG: type I phosphomannose isomerase catalytic subunit [Gemmatales bacterium]
MTELGPLLFQPWLRPMPWGGTHLKEYYPCSSQDRIGEAWLISDHPLHPSEVMQGMYAGRTLPSLVAAFPQEMGFVSGCRFPLLIKILDAAENLSIQVHPDDERARTWSPAEGGKTEAWTILQSDEDACIYLGMPGKPSKTVIDQHLRGNTLVDAMHRIVPHKNETYFLPAGTVHALGKGVMALEVQQTSDATFRLYDWGRVDAAGNPRQLHLEAGLACVQHHDNAGLQQPHQEAHTTTEVLVETPYFSLRRSPAQHTIEQPCVVIPWQGNAYIPAADMIIAPGHACLLPRSMKNISITLDSDAVLFEVRWPL